MNLQQAKNLAIDLMDQHGLLDAGWCFEFNRRKSAAGLCRYSNQTIYLSAPITELADEVDVRNTILHEIAHALTEGHGHDHVWVNKAREIGCNGQRCYDQTFNPSLEVARGLIAKYKAVCPNGHEHFANRLHKHKKSCGQCSNRYDERYLLIYKPNN